MSSPVLINEHLKKQFESKMDQFGFSVRTKRVVMNFGFTSIEQVRDFINENGMTALRTAKAGFGRVVCDELTRIPFLFQTFEEAKRVIPMIESLQIELEQMDLVINALKELPGYQEALEKIKASDGFIKLEAKKGRA